MQGAMTLRIALRALAGNKLRAFFYDARDIIGVGAVIAMVAIGEGRRSRRFAAQIASRRHQRVGRVAGRSAGRRAGRLWQSTRSRRRW